MSSAGKVCPKCDHVRTGAEDALNYQCPACGVIYEKAAQLASEGKLVKIPTPTIRTVASASRPGAANTPAPPAAQIPKPATEAPSVPPTTAPPELPPQKTVGTRACDDCGGMVSVRAAQCPHCGSPQRIPAETAAKTGKGSVADMQPLDAPAKRKLNWFEVGGIWFFIIVFGVMIFAPKSPAPHSNTTSETMAGVQCKDRVKMRLKAPNTADFPRLKQTTTAGGNGVFKVTGEVSAQNTFGALLTNKYVCQIQYKGGDDADSNNWTLLAITLN